VSDDQVLRELVAIRAMLGRIVSLLETRNARDEPVALLAAALLPEPALEPATEEAEATLPTDWWRSEDGQFYAPDGQGGKRALSRREISRLTASNRRQPATYIRLAE
jgi:hypothetical protein